MDLKQTASDAKLLLEIEAKMRNSYIEKNRLQRQSSISSNQPPLFVSHCIFKKKYLLTYVRSYEGVQQEVIIRGISNFIDSKLYRNGTFLVSKYYKPLLLSEGDDNTQDISLLNSTPYDEQTVEIEKDIVFLPENKFLNISIINSVSCSSMYNVKNVTVGGLGNKYQNTGLKSEIIICLEKLKQLKHMQARIFCSIFIQSVMHSSLTDKAAVIVHCLPEKPNFIKNLFVYGQDIISEDRFSLNILQIGKNKDNILKSFKGQEMNYFSMYDIFGEVKEEQGMYNELSREEEYVETILQVLFYWSSVDDDVLCPPPHSAKTVIKLQIAAGETRSAANNAYVELRTLDEIVNHEVEYKSILDSSLGEKIYEKLSTFKDSASNFGYYGNSDGNDVAVEQTDDLEKPIIQFLEEAFQRCDHDFTDKLWLFLYTLDSKEDMCNCVEDILQDIINGKLQPTISPTNETRLAKFIRQMYLADSEDSKSYAKDKLMEFLSSEQAVFNLIGEIGLEKIYKDYVNFFLKMELTTMYNLHKLCQTSKTSSPSSFNIVGLWKLHLCLEAVITPSIHLKLSKECQSLILEAALDYYSENKVGVSSSCVFYLPLMPFHVSLPAVHQVCEMRKPVIWQCCTVDDQQKVPTIYCTKNTMSNIDDENSKHFTTLSDDEILTGQRLSLVFRK